MQNRIKQVLEKGKAKDAKESDKQKMTALFHQPENEYDLKSYLFGMLNSFELPVTDTVNYNRIFEKLWFKIDDSKTNSKKLYLITYLKIAAAVIIGLFVGYFASTLKTAPEPVYYSAYAPSGSISQTVLPDGSVIFLNSDSHIKYSIDGENGTREIFLNGEAYFKVEKNKKRPFIVHTPFYNVNVTGTRFDVKAYENDDKITTTLESGQIIIKSSKNYKLARDIILKPGEQIVFDRNSRNLTVKEVNTKWFTSWKDNKLIFVNMNMKEFITILERKYGVDIQVKNNSILNLHIDCTIKDESIVEILNIIEKTLPVKYKIVDQQIEITKK
jgi:ferric-dicitrate binding protein FerR (iron transport regulator)